MPYRSTRDVVEDLRKHGKLVEVTEPISPYLEMAEIQRRVYARQGPAVLFSNPVATAFPMVSNLFGSLEQARFLFRHSIERVRRAIELKIDPAQGLRQPWRYRSAPWVGWTMLPRPVRHAAVLTHATTLSQLPQLVCWPDDGGAFVTLPQVLSQWPMPAGNLPSLSGINLGMYRVQLSGNDYRPDCEVGMHYQIHRGIGVHHQAALAAGQPLPVSITIGGSPAMTLAAVMPLPEGMSELTFAGALAGHRIPVLVGDRHAPIYADADFVIQGHIDPTAVKPEGPFGDHLGYYAMTHPFPYLNVHRVAHRPDAIWPFTVVGRPPQEDTTFGELIHELTGPIIPSVLPGVRAVHAVDAAGVHPLLLAIGSERYTPYQKNHRPQELLTQSHAILGQGQMSLAKYLIIVNEADDPSLDVHDISKFLQHFLKRVDWERDLHFQTRTTIDTLDYSGDGWNSGSKLVLAASGPPRRSLATEISHAFPFPDFLKRPSLCLPGVLAIEGPALCPSEHASYEAGFQNIVASLEERWSAYQSQRAVSDEGGEWPLWIVVDDAEFASRSLNNFLWVTFTRSNPAHDIDGIFSSTHFKHWGCRGPLIIDARRKPHHAPPLIEPSEILSKVDAMAARGGPLARYL